MGARGRVLWLASGLCLLLAGCQPGVRWRLGRYEEAWADARQQRRLTFVYFRNWYSVDCTRFEDDVLKQPQVRAALDAFVCVPLEYEVDRALAERWNLSGTPAYAIVAPDGTVLEKGEGSCSAEELLAAIERARERFGAARPTAVRP